MDTKTSGLAGVNELFNNILKKIESTAETMKANIQEDASKAAAAIGGDLSALSGELRSLVPQGAALPNINLQSQLASLSGISDPTQAANLLSSITSSFGTELSASGFSLDTLVSDAKTAVAGGKSLSFNIPNFEKSADGVSAAFQKAVAVKLPSIDPVVEVAAKFVENTSLTATKTTASSSVISVSTTAPTKDTIQITIATKKTKITQQTITKEVTTAKDAVEGKGKELKRKNYSSLGFATRLQPIGEIFLEKNMTIGSTTTKVKLKRLTTKITRVQGVTEDQKGFDILLAPISKDAEKFSDTFTISENEITVNTRLRKYEELYVTYIINSTYDPNYKSA